MHPIEWLRAIARRDDLPHSELASEAAAALAALSDDSLGMVPACRRLLDRHPEVGPLWWTCARMLSAGDPVAEARAIQNDLAADQVGLSLALDLPSNITVTMLGWSPLVDELAARRPDVIIEVVHNGGITFMERSANGPEPPDRALDNQVLDITADSLDSSAEKTNLLLLEAWAAGESSFFAQTRTKQAATAAHRGGTEAWLLVGVGRRLPEAMFRALQQRMGESLDPWLVAAEVLTPEWITRTIEPITIGCPCPPELLRSG